MKKAIIVGASSGMGKALALLLANHGYQVGITARRKKMLDQLAAIHPAALQPMVIDVTQITTLPSQLDELAAMLGNIDLLVICAGYGEANEQLAYDMEQKMVDLNVSAFTCIVNWAFHRFVKQGYGHLAAITSIAGLRGSRQAPAYSASKAYQVNYLEALRNRVKRVSSNIFVTDIRPGFVDTGKKRDYPVFWQASVSKASEQILKGILQKREVVYITSRWAVIGAALKFIPRWLYGRV